MNVNNLIKKYPEEWGRLKEYLKNSETLTNEPSKSYKAETNIKVNIAVPTLGRGQITDTIDTILASTYQNISIIVLVQENADMVDTLRKLYGSDEKVDIVFEPNRIGWVAAINKIAQREGHLFALADDVAITRDTIEILVSEMDRIFPDNDGILGLNLTNISIKNTEGFAFAFPFIGNKFINRFPDRQVMCPDYNMYGSDTELPDYAGLLDKCFSIPAAYVIHFENRKKSEDYTKKLTRELGISDIEKYFIRRQKGYLWGKNFDLLKDDDNNFLTILTRSHPKRIECLKRNIQYVKNQTDNNIQHLILSPEVEPTGTGYEKATAAGPLIHLAAPYVKGKYVMQLDDDDMLATPNFVKKIKSIVSRGNVDMIIFKCVLGDTTFPLAEDWKKRTIQLAHIAGPNILVKKEIYDKASDQWLIPKYESDFYYIKKCFELSKNVVWINEVLTCSQGQKRNNEGAGEDLFKIKEKLIEENNRRD